MLNSSILFLIGFVLYVGLLLWRLKKGKTLGEQFIFSVFWFYAVAVLAVTFFPFPFQPPLLQMLRNSGQRQSNFIPFHDIYMMATYDTSRDFIRQVGGNVILFFPLGFLLPLINRVASKFGRALVIGMICSAGIEILQLTIDTILRYNYRTCDVDDFILNTCGFVIGFVVLSIVKRVLPTS